MYGLKLAGVEMNRKMLAELAVNDAEGLLSLLKLLEAGSNKLFKIRKCYHFLIFCLRK